MRTSVFRVDDGRFAWERAPGPTPGAALAFPAPEAARAMAEAGRTGGVRPALPSRCGRPHVLRYDVPGVFSAARLLRMPDPAVPALVAEALRGTGRLLALLHRAAPVGVADGPPPGVRRLRRWLRTGDGPGAAPRLYEALAARLGERRWRRAGELGDWTVWEGGTPLHGAPGLGGLVPSPYLGRAALLTGEELATGIPEFDVGWLLGELAELRAAARLGLGGAAPHDYAALARAVHEGYGSAAPDGLVRTALGGAAVLRVLTHVHDFAAYVGWHDDLTAYLELLADLLDSDGAAATCW
ncbi:hypothetical protein [Streptomyces sp. LaPpAH-108]|uniref:hypothetical protein n=1 Tax=Streptomyces sp. LaPpAH-108 TaxID=1155714 RepID=UPI00039BED6F|nr:hypothetical protein [Streptomyces sp. LaPpAH-108]